VTLTARSFYECHTPGCPLRTVPREIRELVADRQPIYPPAAFCPSCGEKFGRSGYSGIEEPEQSRAAIRTFIAEQVEQRAKGRQIDEQRLARIQAALIEG